MATVNSFISKLNNQLGNPMTDEAMAILVTSCAEDTLKSAVAGQNVTDHLSREQTGVILAAMQWNHNPQIRQAVSQKV